MLALAYYGALRRTELTALRLEDIDLAHRLIRIRAETTKNRRERIVCYSADVTPVLANHFRQLRLAGWSGGALFRSASDRNYGAPLSFWSWSKTVRKWATEADQPDITTHSFRHLRLTHRRGPDGNCMNWLRMQGTGIHVPHKFIFICRERIWRPAWLLPSLKPTGRSQGLSFRRGSVMKAETDIHNYVPFSRSDYQLKDILSTEEREALSTGHKRTSALSQQGPLSSLLRPLQDIADRSGTSDRLVRIILPAVLAEIHRSGQPCWLWGSEKWLTLCQQHRSGRPLIAAFAFHLGPFTSPLSLPHHGAPSLYACAIYGREFLLRSSTG